MSLYHQWQDFVIYPKNANRVHSAAERVNLYNASDEVAPSADPNQGYRLTSNAVLSGYGDVFEAMEIGKYGAVTIWTKRYVWWINREGNDGSIEKLRRMPRHPPHDIP